MRRLLGLFLTLVLAVVGITATASAATAGAIPGMVTDSAGSPLSGVKVEARSLSTTAVGRATTASDGTFTLTDLPASSYSLCFDPSNATGGSSQTGYRDTCWQDVDSTEGVSSDQLTRVTVPDGGTAPDVVQSLPSTGGVSGTVTDRDGTPLAGAIVTAVSDRASPLSARGRTTTDANGRYAIHRLRTGREFAVCVSGEGASGGLSVVGYLDNCYGDVRAHPGDSPKPSESSAVAVSAGSLTALDAIELDAAARIEGTLTNASDQPVAGVRVGGIRVDDGPEVPAEGVTDANGHYVLRVGSNGGWSNGKYSGASLPSVPYRIHYNTHDVPIYASQRYQGVLTAYGTSIGGTAATVTPAAGAVTTADDRLTRAATISGVVTDGHGNGLPGVGVRIHHGDDHITDTYSDSTGRYEVAKLPPGVYRICYGPRGVKGGVSVAGYLDSCVDSVTVTAGQHHAVPDQALPHASGISGTLRGPSSEPLGNRLVRVYQVGVQGSSFWSTDGEGRFLISELRAGTYKVCFDILAPIVWKGCYDAAADVEHATPITTTLGSVVTGIDVQAVEPADLTAPRASMTKPSALMQTGRSIALGVTASDTESGVAGYDVRHRYADWNDSGFTSFISPASWQSRTGPGPTVAGVPGRTSCYSVRAKDNAGNVSRYSSEKCVTVPLDDRALKPTSGKWRRLSSVNAYGNTVTMTSTVGSTLTLGDAQARRLGVVVTTCPTCGRVGVFVNGKRLATLNTWSSTVRRKVLYVPPVFGYRRATISLKLEQRGRSIIVDALAVTRK